MAPGPRPLDGIPDGAADGGKDLETDGSGTLRRKDGPCSEGIDTQIEAANTNSCETRTDKLRNVISVSEVHKPENVFPHQLRQMEVNSEKSQGQLKTALERNASQDCPDVTRKGEID